MQTDPKLPQNQKEAKHAPSSPHPNDALDSEAALQAAENYCLYRQRAQLRIAADEELFRLERLILSGFHGNAEYQRRLKRLKRINRKVRRLEVRIRIHEELLGLSRAIQR